MNVGIFCLEEVEMNFYMLIGPQAVGKMTVGQALAQKTGAKLFYNHMTIDLVDCFFDYGTPEGYRLVREYRNLLFDEVIHCKDYPGFIFTFVCDFDSDDGLDIIYNTCELFEKAGHKSHIIELNSDYAVRQHRNITENRLLNKRMKRDIKKSQAVFEDLEARCRMQSIPGEINWPRYIRIDNTNMTQDDVAQLIVDFFKE